MDGVVGAAGSSDGLLHERDGVVGARGRVLGSLLQRGSEGGARVSGAFLNDASDFGVGRRNDVIDLTAVGGELVHVRLQRGGLQGEQAGGVLRAEQALAGFLNFGQ